jgi:hypothetical protein
MFCKDMCQVCSRAERKAIWLQKATAHFDSPKIRKEAEKMFEDANPL